MTAAVDTGQVVNPDGIRNKVEGGMLQALNWTLFERMTFDRTRVTSIDWSAYPILRFGVVPGSIDVHIIERLGDSFFGVAEAAQGSSGAALANAIRDATGLPLRELPFTASKIKSAIGL
jgi:nicotinate dehydrogenase subunit B